MSVDRDLSFEELLASFDAAVTALESEDLSLNAALDHYETAVKLAKQCTEILDSAELRIKAIDELLDPSGTPGVSIDDFPE